MPDYSCNVGLWGEWNYDTIKVDHFFSGYFNGCSDVYIFQRERSDWINQKDTSDYKTFFFTDFFVLFFFFNYCLYKTSNEH